MKQKYSLVAYQLAVIALAAVSLGLILFGLHGSNGMAPMGALLMTTAAICQMVIFGIAQTRDRSKP